MWSDSRPWIECRHFRALEQAKKSFPNTILIVGCCSDKDTHAFKGQTVMTQVRARRRRYGTFMRYRLLREGAFLARHLLLPSDLCPLPCCLQEERYETMRHCKWVDEVVIDAPWVIDVNFIEKVRVPWKFADYRATRFRTSHTGHPPVPTTSRPLTSLLFPRSLAPSLQHDIDFVCHDDLPYVDVSGASGCGDVYLPMKRLGKFHATQRTEGVSTSDLIIRIVKRYDDYVRRNLARGYSGAEMGVPFIKEKTLQLEMELGKRGEWEAQRWGAATGQPVLFCMPTPCIISPAPASSFPPL